MPIRYYKLFDLLARKGLTKTSLLDIAKISSPTLAKLSKGEVVTTEVIEKICASLDCQPSDIMEYVSNFGVGNIYCINNCTDCRYILINQLVQNFKNGTRIQAIPLILPSENLKYKVVLKPEDTSLNCDYNLDIDNRMIIQPSEIGEYISTLSLDLMKMISIILITSDEKASEFIDQSFLAELKEELRTKYGMLDNA